MDQSARAYGTLVALKAGGWSTFFPNHYLVLTLTRFEKRRLQYYKSSTTSAVPQVKNNIKKRVETTNMTTKEIVATNGSLDYKGIAKFNCRISSLSPLILPLLSLCFL